MTADQNTPSGDEMGSLLEGVMEALENNPELAEIAGKLAGMELPFLQSDTSKETSSVSEAKNTQKSDNFSNFSIPQKNEKRADGSARAVALLSALRPYLNDQRGESVERLLKLLPTARAIRAALHAFGSTT